MVVVVVVQFIATSGGFAGDETRRDPGVVCFRLPLIYGIKSSPVIVLSICTT